MSWLFGDSCDGYATADLAAKYTTLGTLGTNGIAISPGTGSSGSNSIRFTNANGRLGIACDTVSPTLISGRRLRTSTLVYEFGFHEVWEGISGRGQVLYTLNTDGSISAWHRHGNEPQLAAITTLGGYRLATTRPGVVQVNVYTSIQTKTTIHPTNGFVGVVVNGEVVLAVSGLVTQNPDAGVNTYSLAVNGMGHGSAVVDIDDVWFCDGLGGSPGDGASDYLGDLTAEWKPASGVGAEGDWARSSGATNVSCVDDATPDGDATYVASGTVGQTDMYTKPALARVTHGVVCVQVAGVAKKTGAGTRAIGVGVRIGSTDYFDVDRYLSTDYALKFGMFPLNPDTGIAWTTAEIDAAQIGQSVTV